MFPTSAALQMQRRTSRAFTLTEIAIVLGIIGIILGAIWVAAAAVYSNMRVGAASRELLAMVQGMRALYATSNTVDDKANLPGGSSPTTYLHAGIVPSDALDTGVPSTAVSAVNPWGGAIYITAAKNIADNDSFIVAFNAIPSSACVTLLTSVTGAGRDPGMWGAYGGVAAGTPPAAPTFTTGGTTPTIPVLASSADSACATDSNQAAFWFLLRAST
jgi:prepilin-type N-terminal cleavage/methylation domain-containing protein